jgi:transposase
MQPKVLDDWVTSLLPTYNIRKIAAICHLSRDRIRAIRDAERSALHLRGRPAKATPEIKQAVVELTFQHPTFSDLQIAHLITERFGIAIARTTIQPLISAGKTTVPPGYATAIRTPPL